MKILLSLLLGITASLAMETNQSSATLSGSAWQVTSIAGQTPLEGHPITLQFDTEGNVSGNGSCNTFGGTCTIEGKTTKFGPLRSTRRACEPDVMQQEHRFLAMLGSATSWEIDAGGALLLSGEGGEIRAKRQAETPAN